MKPTLIIALLMWSVIIGGGLVVAAIRGRPALVAAVIVAGLSGAAMLAALWSARRAD